MAIISEPFSSPGAHADHQIDIFDIIQAKDNFVLYLTAPVVFPESTVMSVGHELDIIALRLGAKPFPQQVGGFAA